MRVINFGSINIDHVYQVEHFVRPGETLGSNSYRVFAGGKGFNQSIALSRAGADTFHAGRVGRDADYFLQQLAAEDVDITYVVTGDEPTGHAVIQVIPSGENAIVLHGGANRAITTSAIANTLSAFPAGDFLLLQNEINHVGEAIRIGNERGLNVVFNPAPMSASVPHYPLDLVDIFILNETEAGSLTGQNKPDHIRSAMLQMFPGAATVLTMGEKGAFYFDDESSRHEKALAVNAVDTTAAGDTFTGFFLAGYMRSGNPASALAWGCRAAALCVTRPGAADSIPTLDEC